MASRLSLSQRLQQASRLEANTEIQHMTLEQLSETTVTFGTKHMNRTYQQVWETDQPWINYMVTRFQSSQKRDHMMLMRFVDLKLQEVEQNQTQMPVMPSTHQVQGSLGQQAKMKAKPRPKAKSYSMANASLTGDTPPEVPIFDPLEEDFEDLGEASEMYFPATMHQEMIHQANVTEAMQAARMGNIESALQQVIQHLGSIQPVQNVSELEPNL